MSAVTRRRGPEVFPELRALFVVLVLGVAVLGTVVVGAWVAVAATIAAVSAAGLVAYRHRRSLAIDRAAAHLPGPGDLPRLTGRGAAATAARLGVAGPARGVPIGRTVRGNRDLWGSWEDMHFDIWGPRTGKTTSRTIPAVVTAPGSVVVTSNKRDIVDATRGVREKRGPVWVFDPQGQAGEPPSWWWNPLSFVGDNPGKGIMLASFFSGINRASHVRSDAYFLPAGESLFGAFLLAASLENAPITRTLTWLRRPQDDTPTRILRDAGLHLVADSVDMVRGAPPEQSAGVFGTAAQIASPLHDPGIAEWVTPGSRPGRPEFRHADFAERDDATIYLLSEETNRNAAPFVLTLTSALAYSLEGRAILSPGGRLPVPGMFVLDEAANVCPWHELPFLYSHYGSRGIVMMTILQSWAQGVAVWGEAGMSAMWSAANVRVYGGGSADIRFLDGVSRSAPIFEPGTTALSFPATRPLQRTATRASRSERVLDVGDLVRIPRGRAVVQAAGGATTLIRTVPWWERPYAEAITESLAKYAPRRA